MDLKKVLQKIRNQGVNQNWQKKSNRLRIVVKSFYWNLPRSLRPTKLTQEVIKAIAREKENVRFIQISANNGIHSDPIFDFLQSELWNGILIEPNPEIFELLKFNHYESKSELIYENIAIGKNREFTFYQCKENLGIAATTRDHVVAHREDKDWVIKNCQIKMIDFNTLIEKYSNFKKVDLILVNTEGRDAEIVKSIDFLNFQTKLLVCEKSHLDEEVYNGVIRYLKQYIFVLRDCGWDCIAIYSDSKNKSLQRVISNTLKL